MVVWKSFNYVSWRCITRLLTNSRRYHPIPEFPEIIPPQGVWLRIAD
ncbi:hypothetical protein IQ264_06035 [Phormidium sp. LEGE 05292]|nr:hypothetical protein [Phormidium sp. LEGE 05292]MBE9224994.1 hypothetical protein [Phormidium sp. LEGE 05292]